MTRFTRSQSKSQRCVSYTYSFRRLDLCAYMRLSPSTECIQESQLPGKHKPYITPWVIRLCAWRILIVSAYTKPQAHEVPWMRHTTRQGRQGGGRREAWGGGKHIAVITANAASQESISECVLGIGDGGMIWRQWCKHFKHFGQRRSSLPTNHSQETGIKEAFPRKPFQEAVSKRPKAVPKKPELGEPNPANPLERETIPDPA